MEICYDQAQFERYVAEAFIVADGQPVLIDRFLEDATEVDVDAISDGTDCVIMGIMEHIEEAGVHSGDFAPARFHPSALLNRFSPRSASLPANWPTGWA